MGYALRYSMSVVWVGDGANQMSVPSAQVLKFTPLNGLIQVPGGDAPTAANFNTAIGVTSGNVIANSMASDLEAQVLANLTRLQGFATGGG
jgi:hypothetical protein